ncbi:hypothetical protein DENSPDRAFT_757993, partial [Dentipellis sp. KUC8613]
PLYMNSETNVTLSKLTIIQQNINKSNVAQLSFLHSLKNQDVDIACIQEPYIDSWGKTRLNAHWTGVYPPHHWDKVFDKQTRKTKGNWGKTRSLIMVNTNRLHSSAWNPIPIAYPDLTAVRIRTKDAGLIDIINVYNTCEHRKTL